MSFIKTSKYYYVFILYTMFAPVNGRYAQIGKDIETMINLGKYIRVTIYSSENGSTIVNDADGNAFEKKVLSSIGYTYADEIVLTGFVTIKFADGSEINALDDVQQYWYTIDELSTGLMPLV